MVVVRRKINVEGKEIEVPIFDTDITPGKQVDSQLLSKLSEEEDIEREIQQVLSKIRKIKENFQDIDRNLGYFYEVGRILQFVDTKSFLKKQRGLIWQRMARDLEPGLFSTIIQSKEAPKESKRNPEFMYLLAKVAKKDIYKASWEQWYEITKFKKIYRSKKLLAKVLRECRELGPTSLRLRLHELRNGVR